MTVGGGFVNRKPLLTCFVVSCPLWSSIVFPCPLLLLSFATEHVGRARQRWVQTTRVDWGITAKRGCLPYQSCQSPPDAVAHCHLLRGTTIGGKTYLCCCPPLIARNFIATCRPRSLPFFNCRQPFLTITAEIFREHKKNQGQNKGESNNMGEKTLLTLFHHRCPNATI